MPVSLTVLGSADAFNAGGRGNACYLLDDDHGSVCIDFGPTAMAALKKLGRDPNDIGAVYFTHLHGDHFGGIQTLIIDGYYRGFRKQPLTIAGPTGTRERVMQQFALAYRDIAARPIPYPFTVIEYAPGQSLDVLGRQLQIFQADHQSPPGEVACLLRIATGGRVLSFSGDTGWTPELVPAAKGSDLFVCECSFFSIEVPQHLAWTQLQPRLAELGARKVLLTHLSEEMRERADDVRRAADVELADDGQRYEL